MNISSTSSLLQWVINAQLHLKTAPQCIWHRTSVCRLAIHMYDVWTAQSSWSFSTVWNAWSLNVHSYSVHAHWLHLVPAGSSTGCFKQPPCTPTAQCNSFTKTQQRGKNSRIPPDCVTSCSMNNNLWVLNINMTTFGLFISMGELLVTVSPDKVRHYWCMKRHTVYPNKRSLTEDFKG